MTPPEMNPYASPLSDADPPPSVTTRTGNVFLLSAGDATRFVLRHPLAFLLFSLAFSVPLDLVDTYIDVHSEEFKLGPRFSLLMMIAANVVATFSWAALTEMARQDETAEPSSIRDAMLVAASTFLTLLVCDIVVGLLLVVGMIFLLIPGLYVGMRFFFLVPIVVIQRQSVWRSLQSSWQFTQSHQWVSIGFGALFMVVIAVMLGWELLLVGVIWQVLPWDDLPEQIVELSWLFQPTWRIPTTLLADWFIVMTFYGYWRLHESAAENEAGDITSNPSSDL
jgi:hypothetical protein